MFDPRRRARPRLSLTEHLKPGLTPNLFLVLLALLTGAAMPGPGRAAGAPLYVVEHPGPYTSYTPIRGSLSASDLRAALWRGLPRGTIMIEYTAYPDNRTWRIRDYSQDNPRCDTRESAAAAVSAITRGGAQLPFTGHYPMGPGPVDRQLYVTCIGERNDWSYNDNDWRPPPIGDVCKVYSSGDLSTTVPANGRRELYGRITVDCTAGRENMYEIKVSIGAADGGGSTLRPTSGVTVDMEMCNGCGSWSRLDVRGVGYIEPRFVVKHSGTAYGQTGSASAIVRIEPY